MARSKTLILFFTACLYSDCVVGADRSPLDELRQWVRSTDVTWSSLPSQSFAKRGLTRDEANDAVATLIEWQKREVKRQTEQELRERVVRIGQLSMPIWYAVYGEAPKDGRSLFISLHGGGSAPARVNDQQWKNQQQLYRPKEGVYVAPRAPTNTWNLWHEAHIDKLFDRLIAMMMAHENVNPNRVYLLGYSAGGDGVYQLAPRMADRLAAAAMMAGHPNDAAPESLRNLPFAIYMGGKDTAYRRNEVAKEWKEKLADLHESDEGGYEHQVTIFPEFAHWMHRKDATALDWLSQHVRRSWPDRIVWRQDDVTHERFYWLRLSPGFVRPKALMVANCADQSIDIECNFASARFSTSTDVDWPDSITAKGNRITLLLNDELIDLDKPLLVRLNSSRPQQVRPKRTVLAIAKSIAIDGIARPIPTSEVALIAHASNGDADQQHVDEK